MSPTPAPAAVAFRRELTRRYPGRSQVSDGILSSDAHKKQNPTSRHDHGNAVDATHDPASGCDMNDVTARVRARAMAGDLPQVDEIIWNRRICTAAKGWRWRPYRGSNPHDHHAHFSIVAAYRGRTSDWLDDKPKRKPATPREDDDMTPAQAKQLAEVHAMLTALVAPRRADGKDRDPGHIDLGDVLRVTEKENER